MTEQYIEPKWDDLEISRIQTTQYPPINERYVGNLKRTIARYDDRYKNDDEIAHIIAERQAQQPRTGAQALGMMWMEYRNEWCVRDRLRVVARRAT